MPFNRRLLIDTHDSDNHEQYCCSIYEYKWWYRFSTIIYVFNPYPKENNKWIINKSEKQ